MTQRREKSNKLFRRAAPLCLVLAGAVLVVGWANGDFRDPPQETAPPDLENARQAVSETLPGMSGVMPAPKPEQEHEELGISARTVTPAAAEYYCMKEDLLVPGVQIYDMDDEGPAALAGAVPGDIIVALEDREITSEEELNEAERLFDPGDTVHLTVFRNGEYMILETVLPDDPRE